MKTGILFDLDGTLLDTLEDLRDGVNHALRTFGYPEHSLAQIRAFVGNGAARLIADSVPAGADPKPVLDVFRTYYNAHCQVKTRPYPGVMDALAQLKGKYPIAIVSNKPDSAVKALCADYFPGIYAQGETADVARKPAPDMLHLAMEAIGADTCVYVGDSEVDILTSRNTGVPCLSVLWGFRDADQLKKAGGTHFCENPTDLVKLLEELCNGQ